MARPGYMSAVPTSSMQILGQFTCTPDIGNIRANRYVFAPDKILQRYGTKSKLGEFISEPQGLGYMDYSVGAGALENLKAGNYDVSNLCSRNDDLLWSVFRTVVEKSFQVYIHSCSNQDDPLDPEPWPLCTATGHWDCKTLHTHTALCREEAGIFMTTEATPRCPEPDAGFSPAAIGLVVGLVCLGALIGSAITTAVCLMCPNTYRWAASKVRGAKTARPGQAVTARTSGVPSSHYMDIYDRQHDFQTEENPLSENPTGALPTDDSVQPDTAQNLSSSGEYEYATPSYEVLNRADNTQRSHKYAYIEPKDSGEVELTPSDTHENQTARTSDHDYFVLEKPTPTEDRPSV